MSTTTEENDDIMEGGIDSSRVFTEALVDQVNKHDVMSMVDLQTEMLSRYEKTNEMLINFNMLSLARFEATSQEFKQHTQLLYDMKRDLDMVFRRIRSLKQRLGSMYPEAFAACSDVYNILDEENEDEETPDEATSDGTTYDTAANSRETLTGSDRSSDKSASANSDIKGTNCSSLVSSHDDNATLLNVQDNGNGQDRDSKDSGKCDNIPQPGVDMT